MDRDQLAAWLASATDDEILSVSYLAKRLAAGRAAYGPLVLRQDRRQWLRELRDELADAVNYLTWELERGAGHD